MKSILLLIIQLLLLSLAYYESWAGPTAAEIAAATALFACYWL